MRRQLARAPTSVSAPPSHARKRASGQRVEFFIAEVAGNYGDRDGKVAGVLGETGNQRSRSFFAGCGGEYQGGDIFVVLNKVEDLLRFVATNLLRSVPGRVSRAPSEYEELCER